MPKKDGPGCVALIIGAIVTFGMLGLLFGTVLLKGSFVGSPLFMVCLMITVVGLPIAIIVGKADEKKQDRKYEKVLKKAKICPQCGRENALTLNEEVIDRRPKNEQPRYSNNSDDWPSPEKEIVTTEFTRKCKYCNWSYKKTSETIVG